MVNQIQSYCQHHLYCGRGKRIWIPGFGNYLRYNNPLMGGPILFLIQMHPFNHNGISLMGNLYYNNVPVYHFEQLPSIYCMKHMLHGLFHLPEFF